MVIGVGEALAITSLVPPALHAIRLLITDIDNIRNAPKEIQKVKEELESISGIVTTLHNALDGPRAQDADFRDIMCTQAVQKATTACRTACEGFRTQLQKWLKHSTDEKTHWWDSVKVGFLGAKKVAAFVQELNTRKATLSLALNTAVYLASGPQSQANNHVTQDLQDQLRRDGNALAEESSSALTALARISLEDDNEDDEGNEIELDLQSVRELKADIKQGREGIQDYRELLATVLLKYEGRRTGVKVTNVNVLGESKAVVGVQNVEGKDGEIQVDVDHVLVDGGSSAMLGVQGNVDFKGFWNK